MAYTVIGGGRNTAIINNNFSWPWIQFNANATDTLPRYRISFAGTFTRWTANFNANGTARTLTFRKNGANTAFALAPPDSTAAQVSNNTPVAVAAGDQAAMTCTVTGTGFMVTCWSMLFAADNGQTISYFGSRNAGLNFNTTNWKAPSTQQNTSEFPYKFRAPCTVRNMILTSVGNSIAAATTVTSRKNLAAGNATLTVPASTTGTFEDTTNADTIASGDLYDWQLVVGGASGILTNMVGATAVYGTTSSEIVGGFSFYTFDGTQHFVAFISADQSFIGATESSIAIPIGLDATLSKYHVFVTSNTATGTVNYTLRKNSASTAITIAVPTATTGHFEDLTNVVDVKAADQLNYVIENGVSGSHTVSSFGIVVTPMAIPYWQRQRQYLRR
jgi:hypothetical protein